MNFGPYNNPINNPMSNGMMSNYYNPYQQQIQQPQAPQQSTTLIRVTGLDGAKAYQMQPNSVVALFDANEDTMYIKTTDGAGFPTIRVFNFTEDTSEPKPVVNENYITKEEFDEFKKEVSDYVQQFIQQQKESANTSKSRDYSSGQTDNEWRQEEPYIDGSVSTSRPKWLKS